MNNAMAIPVIMSVNGYGGKVLPTIATNGVAYTGVIHSKLRGEFPVGDSSVGVSGSYLNDLDVG